MSIYDIAKRILERNLWGVVYPNGHYIPFSAEGEKCKCGEGAKHKVSEVITDEFRHPYTMYLCCKCFGELMGLSAKQVCLGK